MGKQSAALLKWRGRQKRGAIMKPSIYASIVKKAIANHMRDPKAVAGAAYWKTAREKFRNRRKG